MLPTRRADRTARFLQYRVLDGIAELAIARPPANAVDHDLVDGILDALECASRDEKVRAVVLTSGLDRVFSAGMDLGIVRGATAGAFRAFLDKIYLRLFDLQYRLGKPTIAAVGGAARGAGVTLAISCDVVIASEAASFGYPEIDVGLIPGVHFVHLPRQIGRHAAFEILFTGEPVSADEARALGFVNRVVPPADLRSAAFSLARTFAEKPPQAMRIARNTFMRINDGDYRRGVEGVIDTLCSLIEAPETQDRLRAATGRRGSMSREAGREGRT